MKGYPLKNKQLNALVNKVNDYLNWNGEERVTPHGFRYTIASLLDERGLSVETIKYLLGHSSVTNVDLYLRRHKRKIQEIKEELTKIEVELEGSLNKDREVIKSSDRAEFSNQGSNKLKTELPYSEEFILQLSKSNPELLEKLMMDHYHN
nr:tyrosine-type recombinase/integrase [Peribacillus huizhouensis]